MAESPQPPPRASASSTSPGTRTRNPVLYPTSANESPRPESVQANKPVALPPGRPGYDAKTIVTERRDTPPSAMPSLAQPQRAPVRDQTLAPPAPAPAQAPTKDPTQDPGIEDTAPHDPPPRRVRSLPMPGFEEEAKAAPVIQPPAPQAPRPPVQEKRLEETKTVYVVSDIVDALRADAGYEPLPRDPQRARSNLRPSLWARLREWIRALRSK